MSCIPPEIITDIFSRLPVESLLRFRCVSKSWCSLIDSPHFIKQHLNRSIATNSNLSLIDEYGGSLYSLDLDSPSELVKIETPFVRTTLLGSCNGLLLLRTSSLVYLFNPSTREHWVLPDLNIEGDTVGNLGFTFEVFCLRYESMDDDYKVFNIPACWDGVEKEIISEVRVYSLKSNSWGRIKVCASDIPYEQALCAYVNGAFHQVNQDFNGNEHMDIVAFDIGAGTLKFLPLPAEFSKKDIVYSRMDEFGEYLCFVCEYADFRNDIWVMKEYGVKESWTKLLSITSPSKQFSVRPILYSKSCNEILLKYKFDKLVWYDLRMKTIRNFRVHGFPLWYDPKVYVRSLVPLKGCARIDETKNLQREDKGKK